MEAEIDKSDKGSSKTRLRKKWTRRVMPAWIRKKSKRSALLKRLSEGAKCFDVFGSMLTENTPADDGLEETPLPALDTAADVAENLETETEENLQDLEESTNVISDSYTSIENFNEEDVLKLVTESAGYNVEDLYTTMMYMAQHQINYDYVECSQEETLHHLRQAFKIDDEMHERVVSEIQNMETQKERLSVVVMKASNLVSKDSTGLSDPFCVLYLESSPTKRYNTAVKLGTLDPIWEEYFDLPVEDLQTDALVIEVWDFDAAESVSEKMNKVKSVKGVKGLVKLAKEIAVTATTGNYDNEFIGQCRIPLQEIPMSNDLVVYPLEKKNKSKRRGDIHLKFAFSTEDNEQVALQEHRHLLRILLLHELDNDQNIKYCWTEKWTPAAKMLIHQHGIQRRLHPSKASLSKWIIYSRIHQEHPLSYTLFHSLILELIIPLGDDFFTNEEVKLFWDATKMLLHSCFYYIQQIRSFSFKGSATFNQINAVLGILSAVSEVATKMACEVDLFAKEKRLWCKNAREGEDIDIRRAVELILAQTGDARFEEIKSGVFKEEVSDLNDEQKATCYDDVITQLLDDIAKCRKMYDGLFIKHLDLSYAKTLYTQYAGRITDLCKDNVRDISSRIKFETEDQYRTFAKKFWKLYKTLQRYEKFGIILCPDELKDMEIHDFHCWFQDGAYFYFKQYCEMLVLQIDRAVEMETFEVCDEKNVHSYSIVHLLELCSGMINDWTALQWPDFETSYCLMMEINKHIFYCLEYYAGKIVKKAEQDQQAENNNSIGSGKVDVSVAWCCAVNNMHYVTKALNGPFKYVLRLKDLIENSRANMSEVQVERCSETFERFIESETEKIQSRLYELLTEMAQKMGPTIKRYLMEIEDEAPLNGLKNLENYFNLNFGMLTDHLYGENYEKIYQVIQETVLERIREVVTKSLEKSKQPSHYQNLYNAVEKLNSSLEMDKNESMEGVVKEIRDLLKLNMSETAELIHLYNLERYKEQEESESTTHGLITIQTYFVENLLKIKIWNARNLVPMDSNGECDPYVKIKFVPDDKFPASNRAKTRVIKETLYPLFEEDFEFLLTSEQKHTKDALIHLEVKDKDMFRTRFMAEAFFPLAEVPEVDIADCADYLKQIHLKLSRPKNNDNEICRALKRRKGDSLAADFLSRLKLKLEKKQES